MLRNKPSRTEITSVESPGARHPRGSGTRSEAPIEQPSDPEPASSVRRRDEIRPPASEDVSRGFPFENCDVEILTTVDLESFDDTLEASSGEVVLLYCHAGDPLPPFATYAEELPRFTLSSSLKCLADLPANQVTLARRRRSLPPPRMPRFILEEP
jgi:hypothetical protein